MDLTENLAPGVGEFDFDFLPLPPISVACVRPSPGGEFDFVSKILTIIVGGSNIAEEEIT